MEIKNLVVVRGGGDIATGTIQRLQRSHFNVLVLECKKPSAIRRTVAVSECVYEGSHIVEDIMAVRVENIEQIKEAFEKNKIPVLVDETCEILKELKPIALVDAILAKKNMGTKIGMAPIVIALGPGFTANEDADIVIETDRGHNLGRLIFKGCAKENTGIPGVIKGESSRRVLRAPAEGYIKTFFEIGDSVKEGYVIASVDGKEIKAEFDGLLRGIIRDEFYVTEGFKVGDIDPRYSEYNNCFTISDKARSIGGSVLEAILYLKGGK